MINEIVTGNYLLAKLITPVKIDELRVNYALITPPRNRVSVLVFIYRSLFVWRKNENKRNALSIHELCYRVDSSSLMRAKRASFIFFFFPERRTESKKKTSLRLLRLITSALLP